MIFINYKAYAEASGQRAIFLTRILEEVAHAAQVKIIPVVQATDVREVVSSTTLEVWVQKAVLPEAVFEDGAIGTFLNHSEAKFASFDELAKASDRAKEVGLKTLIFAKDVEELRNTCSLGPNFVAYEPPELIGSTTASVVQAKSEIVTEAAEIARHAGIPLVVGAGVHSAQDVKKSLELGAVGVAVATDVVKAEDPRKELLELTEGFK